MAHAPVPLPHFLCPMVCVPVQNESHVSRSDPTQLASLLNRSVITMKTSVLNNHVHAVMNHFPFLPQLFAVWMPVNGHILFAIKPKVVDSP